MHTIRMMLSRGGGCTIRESAIRVRIEVLLQEAKALQTDSAVVTIPPATLTWKGKTLTTGAVELRVIAPEKQDLVQLTVDADPATVYPLQEFTVRLRIFVRLKR